jgi:hypothetical protein
VQVTIPKQASKYLMKHPTKLISVIAKQYRFCYTKYDTGYKVGRKFFKAG